LPQLEKQPGVTLPKLPKLKNKPSAIVLLQLGKRPGATIPKLPPFEKKPGAILQQLEKLSGSNSDRSGLLAETLWSVRLRQNPSSTLQETV